MSEYENVVENVKVASKADFSAVFANLVRALQTGEIMNDPNMLLAMALMLIAGVVLVACVLVLVLKRSGQDDLGNSSIFSIESRLQALEMAIGDQRNLAITMKNQSKADFGYFKQELKNLYAVVESLEAQLENQNSAARFRKASNF